MGTDPISGCLSLSPEMGSVPIFSQAMKSDSALTAALPYSSVRLMR